jgi:hypothetical protein
MEEWSISVLGSQFFQFVPLNCWLWLVREQCLCFWQRGEVEVRTEEQAPDIPQNPKEKKKKERKKKQNYSMWSLLLIEFLCHSIHDFLSLPCYPNSSIVSLQAAEQFQE